MKKIIFLIALFYSLSFGQGWNSTVTTSIDEPNLEKMDIFTNKDGNHIIIKRTDGHIVYYRINTSGTVKETDTLNTSGDFPNIVGSNDKIYALYKSGSNIKGKYSTNAGASWTNLSDRSISSNTCNGIDAVYELGNGVHLVYATKDSDPNYETYYWRLNTLNNWTDNKNVTDYTGFQYGGNPSVNFSANRVHVSFNTSTQNPPVSGSVKTRDKSGISWQTPQDAVTGSDQSNVEKLVVRGSNLFLIYAQYVSGTPIRVDLANKY